MEAYGIEARTRNRRGCSLLARSDAGPASDRLMGAEQAAVISVLSVRARERVIRGSMSVDEPLREGIVTGTNGSILANVAIIRWETKMYLNALRASLRREFGIGG